MKSSEARFIYDGPEIKVIKKGNGPPIKLVERKTPLSEKYTKEHIAEVETLLAKMPGQPTGTVDNPVPDDYPGLTFDEAVRLEMLISNRDLQQAKRAVAYYRTHVVRYKRSNKNTRS